MRKEFVTKFWQGAYEKLPPGARGHYLAEFQAAERWELALGGAVEVGLRVKNAVAKLFHAPSAKRA